MSEKKRVVETSTGKTAREAEIPQEKRCTHLLEDGRQCRQRRWAGKEVCYQHDESVAMKAPKAVEGRAQSAGFTPAQLQELLAMTLAQVMMGKMPVGRAYAMGYIAQQMLAAHAAAAKDRKLDVKHYWEMVELGAAFERAAELGKERRKEKAEAKRRAEEARKAEEAEEGEETSFAPRGGAQDKEEASFAPRGGGEDEEEASFAPRGGAQDEEEEETVEPEFGGSA